MREIWWVNQYAITPDFPGGTRHYDMAVELARRGIKVKVFAGDIAMIGRSRINWQEGQTYRIEAREGIEFVWIRVQEYKRNDWRRAVNMLSFAITFNRVANELGRQSRPDVVIGSSPHLFAALAAQRVAARLGSRYVLELRDLWPQALVDMGLSERHPGVMAMRVIERYLYQKAERMIILAEGSRRYLEDRDIPPGRTLFVPNGVHLGSFQGHLSREEARSRYGFKRFTIVYAGAHGPANGLETAVRAAMYLRDLPVEIVLVGDGTAKPQVVALAQEQGVLNVRFMDPIPKGEIPDLLSSADVGLITLRDVRAFEYGISPNKLYDYMAAQLPILCSVRGDMAAVVQEARAGLTVAPEQPEELAAAVRHLYAMSEHQRREFGCNGHTYLMQHFRREVLVDRLAVMLCELACQGS